jgi:hypothetical protein
MIMTHPELAVELVAKLEVLIAEPIDAGVTPDGHRRVVPITGGSVMGPCLTGEVLGVGADWSVVRGDGVPVVSARYLIRPLLDGDRPIGVSLEFHQIRTK